MLPGTQALGTLVARGLANVLATECPLDSLGKEPHMRSSAVSSFVRSCTLIAAIAAALAGCASTGSFSATTPLNLSAYNYNPNLLYLTNPMPVRVSRDLLDRYVCSTGVPLVCECMSRFSSSCDCHC